MLLYFSCFFLSLVMHCHFILCCIKSCFSTAKNLLKIFAADFTLWFRYYITSVINHLFLDLDIFCTHIGKILKEKLLPFTKDMEERKKTANQHSVILVNEAVLNSWLHEWIIDEYVFNVNFIHIRTWQPFNSQNKYYLMYACGFFGSHMRSRVWEKTCSKQRIQNM